QFVSTPRRIDYAGPDNAGPPNSAEHRGDIFTRRGAVAGQSSEPASVSNDIFQSQARRVAERGYRRSSGTSQKDFAGNDHHQLSGHGTDLSIIAAKPDLVDAGCGAGDLSGAGHSLRKFHPPADDSFRITLSRFGGAAHALNFR